MVILEKKKIIVNIKPDIQERVDWSSLHVLPV